MNRDDELENMNGQGEDVTNEDIIDDAATDDVDDIVTEDDETAEEPEPEDYDVPEDEYRDVFDEPDDEYRDEYDDEYTDADFGDEDFFEEEMINNTEDDEEEEESTKKSKRVGLIGLIILGVIIIFAIWALGTNSGRAACMGLVAKFVSKNIQNDNVPDDTQIVTPDDQPDNTDVEDLGSSLEVDENGNVIIYGEDGQIIKMTKEPRSEDYVTTYLIFGIESIDGAANTDAIMLISINTKDNTIKKTSILRDTYVSIPGWDKNKINSAYAKGAHGASTAAEARRRGAALLIRTIEETFDVKISGYASVGFDGFEKIVDRLGGLDIELGEKEAKYLNRTNYISKPENRTVVSGWNHLNGNQVMGYVRVRKVETLGGVNDDYGRAARQRRVIDAIIKKYKSSGLFDLLPLTRDCLGYVHTNLTEDQIQEALTLIINNSIYTTTSLRLPIEGSYYDSGKKGVDNGSTNVKYTLVMEGKEEDNIKALHQFLFLDPADNEPATDSATEDNNGAN